MTPPLISVLLNSLFNVARSKYRTEHGVWTDLSYRLAGRFDLPAAMPSIQKEGDIDILLRCLEDEFISKEDASRTEASFHYQMMFSETWIAGWFEILRAFRQRDKDAIKAGRRTTGLFELNEFKAIFHDLELLRMPIAKFEVAKDGCLKQPMPMRRFGEGAAKPIEFYDPKDPSRSHFMPKGVSLRGSAVWLALDARNWQQHWVERRELSDRLLSLTKLVKGAGELEAEKIGVSSSDLDGQ